MNAHDASSRTTQGDTVVNSTPHVIRATERATSRQRLAVNARLTWKDQRGTLRFASVRTRDVGTGGAFVECDGSIPLSPFRLVHLQLENAALESSHPLATGRVLAAVWRVERGAATGGAEGYALRFLVDPAAKAANIARPITPPIAAAC